MRSHSPKDGFVLAFALVMLAIATIVLGGLYTLVSMTARQSIIYEGRNTCRLAAQSAIEYVKPAIEKKFQDAIGGTEVKIGPRSSTAYSWFNLPNGGTTLGSSRAYYTLPSTNIVINGCEVKLEFGPCRQVDSSSSAIVSLIARARRLNANGTFSESVIEELFRFGTGLDIELISETTALACRMLNIDGVAVANQFVNSCRSHSNAVLIVLDFFWNSYFHSFKSLRI